MDGSSVIEDPSEIDETSIDEPRINEPSIDETIKSPTGIASPANTSTEVKKVKFLSE